MTARLKIDEVFCAVDGLVTSARVRLSHAGRSASGVASARTTEGSWRQVVAEATLSAVRSLAGENLELSLDAVAAVGSGRHPIIVATMAIGRGRNEIFLSGTAPAAGDRFAAVAKAVLHGLNRRLEPFLAVASQNSATGGLQVRSN